MNPAPPRVPARILIVDDVQETLDVLHELCAHLGHTVETAGRGGAALEHLAEAPYDLLLLDIKLPDVSGMEVLRFARHRWPDTCVVVITGSATAETAIDALRQGAYDYLQKPFDLADVTQVIARGLERQRLERDNRALLHDLDRANRALQRQEELLQEKVRSATRQLRMLYDIAQQVTRTLSLDDTLGTILEKGLEISSAPAGLLFLTHPEDDGLGFALARGIASLPVGASASPAADSAVGRAVRTREMVGGALSASAGDVGFELTEYQGRDLLVVPLLTTERCYGALAILGAEAQAFSAEDRAALLLFAAQASIAVANAQVYENTRELDRLKSEFVAVVSHEVRTPLTSIKGALELLSDERFFHLNDRQRELFRICSSNIDRLVTLISSILDFSKLEANRLTITVLPTQIHDVLEDVARHMEPAATPRQQTVRVVSQDDLPLVAADAFRVGQVLTNLVSNALKFSPEGSDVVIESFELPDALQISVRDTGPGIATQDLPKLFHRFSQLDNHPNRRVGGTGLGLVICKGIIEQHGGHIWVESAPGKGSTFAFTLPLAEIREMPGELAA